MGGSVSRFDSDAPVVGVPSIRVQSNNEQHGTLHSNGRQVSTSCTCCRTLQGKFDPYQAHVSAQPCGFWPGLSAIELGHLTLIVRAVLACVHRSDGHSSACGGT